MPPTSCLVCGQSAFDPLYHDLLQCGHCGFVTARLDDVLDPRQLYEGDYFTGDEYLDYPADARLYRKTFRHRLRRIRRYCPGGRLIEIGSAYGFFLDEARPHFETVGFEVNPEAARYAREVLDIDVRTEDFLATSPASVGAPVDVIAMWDVIEHLDRPDLFVQKAAELIRCGGLLSLTTGDIGSRLARARGRSWRLIHPPTHLHYFDRRTITRLLANHGFHTFEIRSAPVARSYRQILYSLVALRFRRPALYARLARFTPPGRGFSLDMFDIMQVTAVRK